MKIAKGKNGFTSITKAKDYLTENNFNPEQFVFLTLGKNVYAYCQSAKEKLALGKDCFVLVADGKEKTYPIKDMNKAKALKKFELTAIPKKDKTSLKFFDEKESVKAEYGSLAKKYPSMTKVAESVLVGFLETPFELPAEKAEPKAKAEAEAKVEEKAKPKKEEVPKAEEKAKKEEPKKEEAKKANVKPKKTAKNNKKPFAKKPQQKKEEDEFTNFADTIMAVTDEDYSKLTDKSLKKTLNLINRLREAKEKKHSVEVSVGVIRRMKNENFIVCYYERMLPVYIPFKECFVTYPIEISNVDTSTEKGKEELLARECVFAEKMYGAIVRVFITDMPEKNPTELMDEYGIRASRKEYNLAYEKASFEDGIKGKVIKVGDYVKAKVYAVGNWGVAFNIGGVDTTVKAEYLTNRFIASPVELARKYRVNDTIVLKITDIDTKGKHRKLTAEGRSYERLNAKSYAKGITKGAKTFARVVGRGRSKTDKDKVVFSLCLEETGLPAISSPISKGSIGYTIPKGEMVRVQVLEFLEDGQVYVAICGVHGAGNIGRLE